MTSSFHSQFSGLDHELSLNMNQSMTAMDPSMFDSVNFDHMIGNTNPHLISAGMFQHPPLSQGTEGLAEMAQAVPPPHGTAQLLDVTMHQQQPSQQQSQQHSQLQLQEAQQHQQQQQ